MSPTETADHRAAMALLAELLDLDVETRQERLRSVRAAEPALAARVDALLQAHDQSGSFLTVTPLDGDDVHRAGGSIGPFDVVRELGSGGMGTVWLGVRTTQEFTQQVALKVLRTDMGPGAVARFRHERRILAGLTHPYIAHLVDGGTTADGHPYLAMEYVEGRPITTYANEAGLDVRARLRLLLKVCAAVHYAHQRLVVHRDIKPSNLMVTGDGTPKLLDFGIAKLTEGDLGMGTGTATQAALTPHYASPEQVDGGPLTTATDIYSLGVLAYELLTGVSPYRSLTPSSGALAVLQAIRDEEPERPSASPRASGTRRLDTELDAILLKALHKTPAERYGSADAFAQDIQRYLDGLPVRARRASTAYRVRKFVTRHWAGVTAATVAVGALAAAAAVSTYQARIARQERARAERRFDDVRKLANAFVFEFDDAVRDTPGTTAARKLVIERSLSYLENLARDTGENLALEREIAAAYQRVGDVQGNPYQPNLGERAAAKVSYRRALAVRERLAGRPDATDDDRIALSGALGAMSDLSWSEGDFQGALDAYTRARDLAVALAASVPGDAARVYAAAVGHYRVGQALTKLGRFADAHREYEAAHASLGLSATSPRDHRRFGAVALMKVADCRLREGDVAGARDLYREAADALEQLVNEDPSSANMQRTHAFVVHRMGMAAGVAGDADDAERFAQQALAIQRRLAAADPNDRQVEGDIAHSLSTLGAVDTWRRHWASAEQRHLAATRLYDALGRSGAGFVDQKSERAVALRRLGDLRLAMGDTRAAMAAFGQARVLLDEEPRDYEYGPERLLVNLRAYQASAPDGHGRPEAATAANPADRERWLDAAREEWRRLEGGGVKAWMAEFGRPTSLVDAGALAARLSEMVPTAPASRVLK